MRIKNLNCSCFGVRRQSEAATALWLRAAKEALDKRCCLATPIQSGVARGTAVPRLPPQSKKCFWRRLCPRLLCQGFSSHLHDCAPRPIPAA